MLPNQEIIEFSTAIQVLTTEELEKIRTKLEKKLTNMEFDPFLVDKIAAVQFAIDSKIRG